MNSHVRPVKTPLSVAAWLHAATVTNFDTYEHAPVFTCAEGDEIKRQLTCGHTKNLFLKDKKDQAWLVTALEDTAVDLSWLPKRINAARLSFAKPELLQSVLGVAPGSVTILALPNDHAHRVRVILDSALFSHDKVGCHPLINSQTTLLSPHDVLKFVKYHGYEPIIVDFQKG